MLSTQVENFFYYEPVWSTKNYLCGG